MPRIEFGAVEMTPITIKTKETEINNQEMKSENDHISINNLSREITNAEAIMPDADEPTKLENIPLMMADETSKRWVQITRIVGINKVQFTSGSAPRFMFIVELKWSDENVSYISRDHDDFFRYHCWILDTFKKEAGLSNHPRIIPFLPGKKWFRNNLQLAEERRPLMEAYLNKLVKLKAISDSERAQAFFGQRPGDPKQDDPILQGALLELENGSESPWTRENTKLVINGTRVESPQDRIRGSHDNETFEPEPDDVVAMENDVFTIQSKSESKTEKLRIQPTVLDMNVASI